MKRFEIITQEFDANLISFNFNELAWHDRRLSKLVGLNQMAITENVNGHFRWAVDAENAFATSRKQFDVYYKDRERINQAKKTHFRLGEKIFKKLERFNQTDLSRLSNKKLAGELKELFELAYELCLNGFSFVMIDYVDSFLTNKLEETIARQIKAKKLKRKVADYFSRLTRPEEDIFSAREKQAMYDLALKVKKGKLDEKRKKALLEEHHQRYCWLTYGLSGPPLKREFFEEELRNLLAKEDLAAEFKSLKEKARKIVKDRQDTSNELGLSGDEKYLFDLARKILLLKGYRKEALILAYYLAGLIVKEAAKRTQMPFTDLRFLSVYEFMDFLNGKLKPSIDELRERKKYMVFITSREGLKILLGEKARDYFERHVKREGVSQEVSELKGSIASPGLVKGVVKLVNSAADIGKMKEGDILVSNATQPELLPAMKKAAAIVTDVGGMTCHAAIVSRELGVPCVIGTKIASQVLKDGDLVEVDASHGRVKKVK